MTYKNCIISKQKKKYKKVRVHGTVFKVRFFQKQKKIINDRKK